MGYFRFSLMLAVMYYHIVGPTMAGYMAVFGFFVLSGYVITKASVCIYGSSAAGKRLFLINRFIRIYPLYTACLFISMACMLVTGYTTDNFHNALRIPDGWTGWLWQFTILGQSNFTPERTPARLLPAAWSLSTELAYYLLIGLFIGASRRLTSIAFFLAVVFATAMYVEGYTFRYFYLTIHGPAFAFLGGAFSFHYRNVVKACLNLPLWLIIALANLFIYSIDFIEWPGDHVFLPLFFAGTVIMALLIIAIDTAPSPLSLSLRKSEAWFADVTYPAFLLHWPVGAALCFLLFDDYEHTLRLYAITLPVTLLISTLLLIAIDWPCKRVRMRNRIKASAVHSASKNP